MAGCNAGNVAAAHFEGHPGSPDGRSENPRCGSPCCPAVAIAGRAIWLMLPQASDAEHPSLRRGKSSVSRQLRPTPIRRQPPPCHAKASRRKRQLPGRRRIIPDTVNMKSRKRYAGMLVGLVNVNANKAKRSVVTANRI
jgi:hypothetical protein